MAAGLTRAALLATLGLLVPVAVRAKTPEPVVFAPFDRADHGNGPAWIGRAVAATMAADLRRGGAVDVVDPEQVRAVRREIRARTGLPTATKLAERVQARTVVFGTYNRTDNEHTLQLHAELYDVKAGKSLATADASAPLYRPFEAQDKILATLFGKKFKAPDRSAYPKTVDAEKYHPDRAYRRLDIAMSTDDPNRYRRLRDALDFHEHCYFAITEMEILDGKAQTWARWSKLPAAKQAAELRRILEDPKLTNSAQQVSRSMTFFGTLDEAGFYAAISTLADRVYAMTWTGEGATPALHANALYWKRHARTALRDLDGAIAAGEKSMKEFPKARYFGVTKSDVARLIKTRDARAAHRQALETKLTELEEDAADTDLDRCQALQSAELYLQAIRECQRFVATWSGNEHPEIQGYVLDAQKEILQSYAALGDFDKARALAKKLVPQARNSTERSSLERQIRTWPQ